MNISVRWNYTGSKPVEVFTYKGVDYVRGSPGDLVLNTSVGEVSLKKYDVNRVSTVLCPRHKNYQAMRKPRTNCKGCWEAYEQKRA